MSKYAITSGTIAAPVKTVLYGPEGIGKSTFAAQFPAPVFIDTEGGTKRLNVARLPAPTSWAMLLDEVAEVSRGNVPCGTLVIDTADWAERLCIDAVCARAKVKAFASSSTASLGQEIPLADVPEWADITPEVRIEVERPLFSYFRIPLANRNDRHSPLGASVYAPAVDTIHDADEQFGRLLWEYEGGQLAIDVDAAALRPTGDGGFQMDQRSGRLYRGCMTGNVADRTLFNVFAPALRDEAYLRGLDGILKRIEFQCGLAYGTLSDPQNVDKTATEIMASKQRSYSTVKSIQHALQVALDDLLYAMNAYADLYQLVPAGSYTAVYNWDDSIVNDPSERKQLFWQYVQAGKFPMQRYLTEFEGYSQEEAAQIAAETSAENNADEALTFAP